jgi:hypothetical protein
VVPLDPQPSEPEGTRKAVKVKDAQATKSRRRANSWPIYFTFATDSSSFVNVPSEPPADLIEGQGELFGQSQSS